VGKELTAVAVRTVQLALRISERAIETGKEREGERERESERKRERQQSHKKLVTVKTFNVCVSHCFFFFPAEITL
jgi:hypothetical protein